MNSEVAIIVENLSKVYKLYNSPIDRLKESLHPLRREYHHDFYALRDINFDVKKGQSVGIIGKNGSGKSTLLKILTGVLTPTTGNVTVNGKVSALLELGAGFNPELTGLENVYFNGMLMGYTRAEMSERLDNILSFADIGEFVHQPVKTYSSGMFVRLAFAVAINVDPDILIVDEALSVGDELFQRKCFARIKEFQNLGKTIFFVSHGAAIIIELCDRAMMFEEGKLIVSGTPKHVVSLYQKFIYSDAGRKKLLLESLTDLNSSNAQNPVKDSYVINHEDNEKFDSISLAYYVHDMKPVSTVNYESNGAEISNPAISSIDGKIVNMLIRGDEYFFSYDVDFIEDAWDVRFGMLVKTLTGLEIFGLVSHCQNTPIVEIKKGQKYTQRFRFKCDLTPGTYFLNAGVLAKKNNQEVFLHRIVDLTMFKVQDEANLLVSGIVDLSCNKKDKVNIDMMDDFNGDIPEGKFTSEAVCILGMHRSGTSSVSRAFNLLGYYIGEDHEVINASPENPKGFWELFEMMCIHREILYKLNLDWHTTTAVPIDKLQSNFVSKEKAELKNLVLSKLAVHPKWMWKDPRTCLLMPLWFDILREINASLKCVFVVRNPLDVARSLEKRNGFTLEKGFGIWLLNNLSALKSIHGQKVAFISYEKYVNDWEGETRRAARILNIDWPSDDTNIRKEMSEFIEPGLQHSKSSTTDLEQAPLNIKILYDHLLLLTSDDAPIYIFPEAIKNMALNERI